jgi:hypothetical protein
MLKPNPSKDSSIHAVSSEDKKLVINAFLLNLINDSADIYANLKEIDLDDGN